MNHPAAETWVAYVYNELPPPSAGDAETHLRACSQCRQTVEHLRTTMTILDQDKASLVLPRRRETVPAWMPAVRWALAASVVLATGFLAGRLSGPSRTEVRSEVAAVRQELQTRFQDELKQATAATVSATADANRQLLTEFAHDLQTAAAADRRDLRAALDVLDQRRALDSEALRAGLVILARRTGTGFQQAESQLSLLASYLPAGASPGSPDNSIPEKQP